MNFRKRRILKTAVAMLVAASMVTFGATAVGATGEGNTSVSESRAIPSGAYRLGLNVNGRRVLDGSVFNINGTTYVPMFRFADWLGVFTYSYNPSTAEGTVPSEDLLVNIYHTPLNDIWCLSIRKVYVKITLILTFTRCQTGINVG